MAYAWSWFGVANLVASAMLLVLALLFLKARRSEFTLAFAAYSVLTAAQKFSGGMWLYFSADLATRELWQTVVAVLYLPLIPTLAYAIAVFLGGKRFEGLAAWKKALLFVPPALLAPLLFIDRPTFEQASFTLAMVFTFLLLPSLLLVARRHKHARTAIERTQAKYLLVYLVITLSFTAEARVFPFIVPGRIPWWELAVAYTLATGFLLYGILKYHLFAVDLLAKRATYYTLITAALAGAFIVLEQVVTQLVDLPGYESLLAALGAALLIAPVAHYAKRPVEQLFPAVARSDAYFERRKEEIYRAQLELALADGFITRTEHELLERSRRELGITEADHDRLEREMRARLPPGVAAHA